MVHKAALSTESAAYRVVIPSQAFTRKISRLVEAVAIFRNRVTWHAASARDAAVLQRTAEPGPGWCLYCTLRQLPFGAQPVDVCASRQRDSDGFSHFLFYLHPLLCRSRLSEADPSPALWAAPFSKGARFMWVESLECMDNHAAEPRLTAPLFKGSSPAEDC